MAADNIRRSLTSNPRFREWKAAYIATQAPLPETKFDGFWSMVWKQRVSVIIYEITKKHPRGRQQNNAVPIANVSTLF
jgi:protein tyrosine phosphatase